MNLGSTFPEKIGTAGTQMNLRSIILAFAAAAFLASAVQAAEHPLAPMFWDSKERLPKPDLSALPRLRFLTTTDFPPFNYLDRDGRLSGFHIDLVRAICAELGSQRNARSRQCPGSS